MGFVSAAFEIFHSSQSEGIKNMENIKTIKIVIEGAFEIDHGCTMKDACEAMSSAYDTLIGCGAVTKAVFVDSDGAELKACD